jgi:hypothetical protein
MTTSIHDLHIAQSELLPEPRLLLEELPAGETEADFISDAAVPPVPFCVVKMTGCW